MRKKKTTVKLVTFEVSTELWTALKVRAYSQETSIKDYLSTLLKKDLGLVEAK